MTEHGPFETEDEALATEAAAVVKAAYDAVMFDRRPGVIGKVADAACLKILTDACEAAGVKLGAYELRTLSWLSQWETGQCVALAGIIRRAHDAGKAAALEGAVTQWGLRLTGDSGEPIFASYPDQAAAEYALPGFQGVFDTVVVRCHILPWEEASSAG